MSAKRALSDRALTDKNTRYHTIWALLLVAAYCAGMYLTSMNGWGYVAVGSALVTLCLIQAFSIAHECSHGNWMRTRRGNTVAGRIAMIPILTPYDGFKRRHSLHHAKTNDIDHDDAWTPLREEEKESAALRRLDTWIRCYLHFLGPMLQTLMRDYTLRSADPKNKRPYKVGVLINVCAAAAYFSFLWINPSVFWFGFLVPMVAFYEVLAVLGLLHHGAFAEPQVNRWERNVKNSRERVAEITFDTPMGRLADLFFCFQNYHVSHHLNTRIPFYRYKRAHESLVESGVPVNTASVTFKAMKNYVITLSGSVDRNTPAEHAEAK